MFTQLLSTKLSIRKEEAGREIRLEFYTVVRRVRYMWQKENWKKKYCRNNLDKKVYEEADRDVLWRIVIGNFGSGVKSLPQILKKNNTLLVARHVPDTFPRPTITPSLSLCPHKSVQCTVYSLIIKQSSPLWNSLLPPVGPRCWSAALSTLCSLTSDWMLSQTHSSLCRFTAAPQLAQPSTASYNGSRLQLKSNLIPVIYRIMSEEI